MRYERLLKDAFEDKLEIFYVPGHLEGTRGEGHRQEEMFLYASLEEVVPADLPLRPIRSIVNEALRDWRTPCMRREVDRPSIAAEPLLRTYAAETIVDDPERVDARSSCGGTICGGWWFVKLGINEDLCQTTVLTLESGPAAVGRWARHLLTDLEACQAAGWNVERALFSGCNHCGGGRNREV